MNQLIISEFERLVQHLQHEYLTNKETNLRFKISNFKKVIGILKQYPTEITSGEELKSIRGIGKGAIQRIDEIIQNKFLNEIPKVNSEDSEINEINNLLRVTGIGPSNAKKMFKNGITLDKLISETDNYWDTLTHHQKIGVSYFKDFEKKIPRIEIKSIENKISKLLQKIDSNLKMYVCGSYRRNKIESGDIDVLITHEEIVNSEDLEDNNILSNIINFLTEKNILVDHLTINGNTKYMGVCKLTSRSYGRRIDIRLIPKESIGCALLYFTGCGDFNVNMRSYASKKGYKINEYNLLKKVGTKFIPVKINSEKDIFNKLGLEYIEPSERLSNVKFE